MLELFDNVWKAEYDAPDIQRCVLVNGSIWVRQNRKTIFNPMGGGTAGEARRRYEGIEERVAQGLATCGLAPWMDIPSRCIIFPTKWTMGEKASLSLILLNTFKLTLLADMYHWHKVLLPRPGCGLGGLDWDTEVMVPLADQLMSNLNITVCHYAPDPTEGFWIPPVAEDQREGGRVE